MEDISAALRLVVADTTATNHMLPDRLAFILYKSIRNLRVRMRNNSFAPVLGWGTAIISLNRQCVLICNVLHVLANRIQLYIRAHLGQPGCSFVGSNDTGMHVYFPGVVLSVNNSTNCHLSYKPLGKLAPFSILQYVQPRCALATYPTESLAFRAGSGPIQSPATPLPCAPTVIEDDVSTNGLCAPPLLPGPAGTAETSTFISPVPNQPPANPKSFSTDDIASIKQHLQGLSDKLAGLQPPPPSSQVPSNSPPSLLLSMLSRDEVMRLVHRPGSKLPQICPCNCANKSNTKMHWTSEELHQALGCWRFRNYKHIIQAILDGHWVNGGKFPMSLGAYTTIPKAPCGGAID